MDKKEQERSDHVKRDLRKRLLGMGVGPRRRGGGPKKGGKKRRGAR